MQIFVGGTWKAEKARPYRAQALELGAGIAAAGFDLACGPGNGIARHVIDGFRQAAPAGKVRYYLPAEADMRAAGEEVMPGADEIERTGLDYPIATCSRSNAPTDCSCSPAAMALEEVVAAVVDYRLPVAIVAGSGTVAAAVTALLDVYPEWRALVELGPDVASLLAPFLARIGASSTPPGA